MPILVYWTCRVQNNSLTSYILLLQSLSAHTFPLRLISTKGNFSLLSLSATPISNVNQKRITPMRYQKGHIQFKWVSQHFRSCSGHWVNVWLSLRTNGLLFENILKTIHFFYSFLHLQLNCQYFMVAENLLPLRPFVECSCTRFWNQRVSVKWLSVFICTLVPQCTHLYTCRAILEIILAVSKWFLNLIWEKIFLGPNSFYLRRCMQSVIVNKLHWKNITALKDYRYSRS